MCQTAASNCSNCEKLREQVERLQEHLHEQQQTIVQLTGEIGQLKEQLAAARKDSSTSSKPPSSDIVKPPKPAPPPGQAKRHIGAQPGHPKHERAPFAAHELTGVVNHTLDHCPDCGCGVFPMDCLPRLVQQVDILQVPLLIHEHRAHGYWCFRCQKQHYAPLPLEVDNGGLVGANLTALIAYLKGVCHASFSTIRKFLRDIAKLTISRGQLSKIINKVSLALEGPYDELLEHLAGEAILNVDETGHKTNGDLLWTWCLRAELYTVFKIDPRRSADVLIEVLGKEFDGVLGCDYFSAYRRYMREFGVKLQFCLAHLIRDVKYMQTLPDWRDRLYGMALGKKLRELFAVIHRKEQLSEAEFQRQLEAARQEVLSMAKSLVRTPAIQAMIDRFEKHGESYFRFITTPGVEPTNNLAEQAIRFVVIDRHITQGTRGEKGQRWSQCIWTVIATCSQQGRSVWEYLRQAVKAHFTEEKAPSLLPART